MAINQKEQILSVVIPVFNEARTIELIINRILSVDLPSNYSKEIIAINDYSTDKSLHLLEEMQKKYGTQKIIIANQETNQGKGAAINKGISLTQGKYVIIQDADLEYDPKDYHSLLSKAISENLDVVYGSRFVNDTVWRTFTSWHTFGNRFLTGLSNLFTGLGLTDMETCYKLIRGDIIRNLELQENRFGIEPEITAKLAKIKGLHIREVSISYDRRGYDEGKKIGWKDGVRAIYCIIRYR